MNPSFFLNLFTFQYGSIQIGFYNGTDLNSFIFTFQYGSIQILKIVLEEINKNIFTFQYGSIQINYEKN